MPTKKTSSKRSTLVKKTTKTATKNLTAPEEKIDTRVKIQGQSLSIMRDMSPAKLEGLKEKTPQVAQDLAVQEPIEENRPTEIKIPKGQAKQVSEQDKAQAATKPTIAKEISISEEDYSPEVLSDLSHDNKIKKQMPIIWIIVLVVIIVALIGLIINWYFNQYGSTAKIENNSKILSASVKNTPTPSASDTAPQVVGEIDQKFNELNKLTNQLDTDNLTREPSISVNVSE